MNVEDAIAYLDSLEDEDEDATGLDILLEPPDDGAESDADDPNEDVVDVVEENVKLLGARLLAKPAHIQFTNRCSQIEPCSSRTKPINFQQDDTENCDENEREQPPKKKNRPAKPIYHWKKCDFQATCDKEEQALVSHNPSILHEWSNEGVTPGEIFKKLWNEELMHIIMTETNRYHQDKFGKELSVTVEELYKVLWIFLLSGYNTVPNRRLY